MFNAPKASTTWLPYKIPPTPTIPSGSTDSYNLTCGAGADGEKNPSQFLKWKKNNEGAGLPEGAIAKEFDVCENGQAQTYWFVVWEQEPNLAPPPEEEQ